MAQPITITFEQSRRYLATDYLQLEVDSVTQSDRITIWTAERRNMGFGHGRFGTHPFGQGRSLGFGVGAFGRGRFGQGVRLMSYQTGTSFVAADYALRMRGKDRLANAGSWSSQVTHRHRPTPPSPQSLRVTSGSLVWSWSDP